MIDKAPTSTPTQLMWLHNYVYDISTEEGTGNEDKAEIMGKPSRSANFLVMKEGIFYILTCFDLPFKTTLTFYNGLV